jgi:hypothetical protein
VAKDGQTADVDVDAFRHVDIDVPEDRHDRHCRPLLIDSGSAQIEVKISEGAGGDSPPAQPEPPAPGNMAKQRRSKARRLAPRADWLNEYLGQVVLHLCQFPGDFRLQGNVDAFRELLKREAAGEKMLPERDDGLLAIGV